MHYCLFDSIITRTLLMMHFIQIDCFFFYFIGQTMLLSLFSVVSMILLVCIAQIFIWIVSLELLVKRQRAIKLLILFVFLWKHIFQLHFFLYFYYYLAFSSLVIKRKTIPATLSNKICSRCACLFSIFIQSKCHILIIIQCSWTNTFEMVI